MNRAGIAIFVKTPSLSPVKTRLSAHIGQRCAEAFHLASAEAVASVSVDAQARVDLAVYWAVAEPEAMLTEVWSDLPKMEQGAGALGERMANVHRRLLQMHRAAILIGADSPQVTAERMVHAVRWLDSNQPRLVIGRANDGGFWTFGSNVPIPETVWRGVRYSTHDTASRFIESARHCGEWLELDPIDDVDTYADFAPALHAIRILPHPTEAQRRLASWMSEVMQRGGRCS
ncbi:MAG: DUF2064 domain-containing protein [Xanthomonadaceae bacterium]|nr:DUF2064 domain-containing protein [Xanthomonadaceae bacterium]